MVGKKNIYLDLTEAKMKARGGFEVSWETISHTDDIHTYIQYTGFTGSPTRDNRRRMPGCFSWQGGTQRTYIHTCRKYSSRSLFLTSCTGRSTADGGAGDVPNVDFQWEFCAEKLASMPPRLPDYMLYPSSSARRLPTTRRDEVAEGTTIYSMSTIIL